MDSQRYLRCLGQPVLFTSTGEPIRFRTRKHLALLVYIAVEGRPHRRDRLAELLWPKVSSTEARHSLATALSVIRPRLGLDGLETSRDHVRLVPGRVTLDLERLQSGNVLGSEVSGPLEVAAFLDGFDINDSAEFTHWKDRQQARLLPVIKDALLLLIDQCRRRGDTRQIEQLADRMLALDDLSEEAIRAKMEARAFAGDRLTALEIFEQWKKKLAEELQAAPSDLVEGMAVRLRRRGWERTTLANIPNVPTDQWRGRPFIGRTTEYRVLYEIWEAVHGGASGHALLLGDSGVGKTTLAQRLTTAAGLEGAAISRVQCYDIEREIPYSTLNSLVLGLLDRPGISATPPEALAELSRTVPEVRHRFSNIPQASDSQGETARIRLTEAFLQMLKAIAEEHPVILVIDDLHLADDVSLAVLHLVMRRTRGLPIMVLLIARPGELDTSCQALRLRETAGALGIREIELSPLKDEESRQLLSSLIRPDEPQPGVADQRALLRASAGYPMVLELLVHDWQMNPQNSLALGIDAMTAELETPGTVQSTYPQILERITRSLDSTSHNVLNLAAILGHRLNDIGMYGLVDLSPGQTVTAMADLVGRRVLRDGAQGLEFANELVRAAVYVGLPQTLRRVLHGNIADRFIGQHTRGDDELGLEIAWHCIRAGRVKEATKYLMCGARDSIRKGAVHSAERALSTAIPHLADDERKVATLLLAEVLQEQGRWLESYNLLLSAGQTGSGAGLILSLVAEHWLLSPTPEKLLSNVRTLRAMIDSTTDVRISIKAARAITQFMSYLRDDNEAKESLRSINRIPTHGLTLDDLASLSASKARLYYDLLERGSCISEIRSIAAQLRNKNHANSIVASLHSGLGALGCCEGRYLDAKNEFKQAYDISAGLGNDTIRGNRAAQIALCCFRLGEYQEAIEWSQTAFTTFGPQFAGYTECQVAQYTSASHAILGNQKRALEVIAQFDLRRPQEVPAWVEQAWLFAKADVLQMSGCGAAAIAAGREAVGKKQPVLYSAFFAGPFARWLALTSVGTIFQAVAQEKIMGMLEDLGSFDVVDQLEILCARNILLSGPQRVLDRRGALMQKKLSALPIAVAEQLKLLGVLYDY